MTAQRSTLSHNACPPQIFTVSPNGNLSESNALMWFLVPRGLHREGTLWKQPLSSAPGTAPPTQILEASGRPILIGPPRSWRTFWELEGSAAGGEGRGQKWGNGLTGGEAAGAVGRKAPAWESRHPAPSTKHFQRAWEFKNIEKCLFCKTKWKK